MNAVKEEILIPRQFSASGKTVSSCYPVLACGISKYTGMEEDYITVFNQSDLALTQARKSSSQNIIVYDDKMQKEQDNQLKLLNEHNCDFVQGYVWGKPMAYDDAIALSKTI